MAMLLTAQTGEAISPAQLLGTEAVEKAGKLKEAQKEPGETPAQDEEGGDDDMSKRGIVLSTIHAAGPGIVIPISADPASAKAALEIVEKKLLDNERAAQRFGTAASQSSAQRWSMACRRWPLPARSCGGWKETSPITSARESDS